MKNCHFNNYITLCGFLDWCFYRLSSLHLNDLNSKLQGPGKTINVTFDNIKASEIKLKSFKRDVDSGSPKFFKPTKTRE
jgi:hypothetical protein